jgi:hypothetical protein
LSDGAGPAAPSTERSGGPITVAEVLTVAAVLVVAAVGTASLALAQLGRHSAAAGVLLALVLLAPVAWLGWRERPIIVLAPRHLVLAGVLGAVGLVMFLPGFPYLYADKDPGVYVVHSLAIARDGDVRIDDPVLEADLPGVLFAPGARFPGIWIDGDDTDRVTPQFFHFFPSLAATAVDVTDERAAFHLNPLLGSLSVVAFGLGARRAFGTTAAVLAGGLLAIAMPQVWQAKYPSTEVLAQLLLVGALLAVAIAADRRSRTFGLIAGLLVGTGFLARPDGLLPVVLTIGAGGLLLALGRLPDEARWTGIGLAATLPYACLNAYGLRSDYTLGNEVPGLPLVAAGAVAVLVGGRLARRPVAALRRRGLPPRLPAAVRHHPQRVAGLAAAAALGVLFLVLANREQLFGIDYTDLLGPEPRRSYDEINLWRLTWYLTRLVPVLAVVGLAVVGWQRWRAARWLVLVPGLAMVPLYLIEAQISPRLMWWVRRFVPGVVPVLLLLAAVALAWALHHRRWPLKVAAVAALGALVVAFADLSLPLRDHREMGGSYEAAREIADVAGAEQGLFLWERPVANDIFDPSRNLGSVVWLAFDHLSALLPDAPDQTVVDQYRQAFPDRPIYVVATSDQLPGQLPPSAYEQVADVERVLSVWREDVLDLPRDAVEVGVDVTVWQLAPEPIE